MSNVDNQHFRGEFQMRAGERPIGLQRVETPRVIDEVASRLRVAILSGAIAPGQRLIETEVAETLGISRGALREAIHILRNEGLVVSTPRKGTYVISMGPHDVDEIYDIRTALEIVAMQRALRWIVPADFGTLAKIIDDLAEAARKRDLTGVTEANMTFHRTICQISRYERLLKIWTSIELQVRMLGNLASQFNERLDTLVASHQALIDALKTGDPARCESAVREHIALARKRLAAEFAKRTAKGERGSLEI